MGVTEGSTEGIWKLIRYASAPDLTRVRFTYDKDTGKFTLTKGGGLGRKGEEVTSTDSHGYIRVSIAGRRYSAHRVAWLIVHGEWPECDIDHINGDKTDNRVANLRKLSRSDNLVNQKKTRGVSKHKGVTFHNGLWIAQFSNRVGYLGCSKVEDEAAMIYNIHVARNHNGVSSFPNKVFEDTPTSVLEREFV